MPDKYTITLPVFDYCLSADGKHPVLHNSDFDVRQALEGFARYFKAELGFDNVQYYADEHDENCLGFLFTQSALDVCTDEHIGMPTRCFGGCCFRKEQHADGEIWVLSWIWLHPFFRNRGTLTKYWGYFRSQFNEFALEPPLSDAMKSFLKKQDL
ncbi:MAG: hypothetical protein JWQ80_1116 [Massilia sp.]|nr:hypothetical protein [Massilia sp.]